MYKTSEISLVKLIKLVAVFLLSFVAVQFLFTNITHAAVYDAGNNQIYPNNPPTYGYCDPAPNPDNTPNPDNWGIGASLIVNKFDGNGSSAGRATNFKVRIRSYIRDDASTAFSGPVYDATDDGSPDNQTGDLRDLAGQPYPAIVVGHTPIPGGIRQEHYQDTVDVTLNNSNRGQCTSYNIDSGLLFYNRLPQDWVPDPIKRGMDRIALDCVSPFSHIPAAMFTFELVEVDGVVIPEDSRPIKTLRGNNLNHNVFPIEFDYGVEGSFLQCDALQITEGSTSIGIGETVKFKGYGSGPPGQGGIAMEYYKINPATWDGNYSSITPFDTAQGLTIGSDGNVVDNDADGRPTIFTAAGTFQVHLRIVDGGKVYQGSGQGGCVKIIQVAERPYFKVYGNDVRAGGQFEDSVEACGTELEKVNILTYSRNIGGSGNAQRWVGASAQYAVSATGNIDSFFSAGRRNGLGQPKPPTDLTFGNYNGTTRFDSFNPAPGTSGMGRCIPDYFEVASNNGASNGPSTIGQLRIGNGGDPLYLYEQDTFIDSNIQFNRTDWSAAENIPSFTLIVKGGDIYINSEVSQLDGLYVAQPDENGKGGRIFTCATGIGSLPPRSGAGNIKQLCGGKLTINGAFIARQVRFLRSGGDVSKVTDINEPANSSNIAEVFNFSPETYLSTPRYLQRGSTTGRYDSILSLPPVL